jgi:hypothetical protein
VDELQRAPTLISALSLAIVTAALSAMLAGQRLIMRFDAQQRGCWEHGGGAAQTLRLVPKAIAPEGAQANQEGNDDERGEHDTRNQMTVDQDRRWRVEQPGQQCSDPCYQHADATKQACESQQTMLEDLLLASANNLSQRGAVGPRPGNRGGHAKRYNRHDTGEHVEQDQQRGRRAICESRTKPHHKPES